MDDNRYLNGGEYAEEESEVSREEKKEEVEYYELPENIRARSMIWSVLSLVMAILSVVLCPIFYLGLAFSVLSAVFAVVSRRNLGYFDRMTLFGLIVAIFGFIFGVFSMIMDLTGLLDGLLGK